LKKKIKKKLNLKKKLTTKISIIPTILFHMNESDTLFDSTEHRQLVETFKTTVGIIMGIIERIDKLQIQNPEAVRRLEHRWREKTTTNYQMCKYPSMVQAITADFDTVSLNIPIQCAYYVDKKLLLYAFIDAYFDKQEALVEYYTACSDDVVFVKELIYLMALRVDHTVAEKLMCFCGFAYATMLNVFKEYAQTKIQCILHGDHAPDAQDIKIEEQKYYERVERLLKVDGLAREKFVVMSSRLPSFLDTDRDEISTLITILSFNVDILLRNPSYKIHRLCMHYDSIQHLQKEIDPSTPMGLSFYITFFTLSHLRLSYEDMCARNYRK